MTDAAFKRLANPAQLADFPVDDYVAYVAGLPWNRLDDEWNGPCYRVLERHVPGFQCKDFTYEFFLDWRDANKELVRTHLKEEFMEAIGRFQERLGAERRIRLLGLVSAPNEGEAMTIVSAPHRHRCGYSLPFWRHDLHPEHREFEEHQSIGFSAADLGIRTKKGNGDWYIEADYDEAVIDWALTLMFVVGFSDFEQQVWLRNGAVPAQVLRATQRRNWEGPLGG